MKFDWFVVAQSRLRTPIGKFFEKQGVTTYEQAVEALKRAGLSYGSREEMAQFLPDSSNEDSSSDSLNPASVSSTPRRTQEILEKKKSPTPASPAEAAADAITKSKAVKSPKSTQKKRSSRRRKST